MQRLLEPVLPDPLVLQQLQLHLETALTLFARTADLARKAQDPQQEALAQQGCCTIQTGLKLLKGHTPQHISNKLKYQHGGDQTQTPAPTIELRTLGPSGLWVDGKPAHLELRRSLEVLAYLLCHPASGLESILSTLFPETEREHARSYFHQVRYELARVLPGFCIPFDAPSKTYSAVWGNHRLLWDVHELALALQQGEAGFEQALALYAGPFLSTADNEWVQTEREALAWSVVKVGLELIQEWYGRGQYQKCLKLALRLLEIEPYDEALSEYLIRATWALEGDIAARRECGRLMQKFEQELGMVPPSLDQLHKELHRG